MSEETSGSILGLVILGVIGYGLYAYFDKKPSETDQKQQQQQQQAQEIQELKAKITELENKKPEHRYELRTLGFRTWRFDPATGDSCIQFSTATDWKKAETKRQGCEYQDMVKDPKQTNGYLIAECWVMDSKGACDRLNSNTK
jgi:hypothetical protein